MKKSKSSWKEAEPSPSSLIDARIAALCESPGCRTRWACRPHSRTPRDCSTRGLEGNVRRAIDIREGDRIDEKALQALVRAAVALNTSRAA